MPSCGMAVRYTGGVWTRPGQARVSGSGASPPIVTPVAARAQAAILGTATTAAPVVAAEAW